MLAYGHEIQKCLGGVCMGSVARVDDGNFGRYSVSDKEWGAASAVSNDEQICLHGLQIF